MIKWVNLNVAKRISQLPQESHRLPYESQSYHKKVKATVRESKLPGKIFVYHKRVIGTVKVSCVP